MIQVRFVNSLDLRHHLNSGVGQDFETLLENPQINDYVIFPKPSKQIQRKKSLVRQQSANCDLMAQENTKICEF